MNLSASKKGFTLVELLVVISVIILVTGMTIPMMMGFFEKEKLPRAAKVLATYVRSAQVVAMNYSTKTQIELVPGTDNTVRTWGFAGLCKWPTRSDGEAYSWDRTSYMMVTESRKVPRTGGTIRVVPINRYSLEPVNAQGMVAMGLGQGPGLSGQQWEYSELTYSHFGIQTYDNSPGGDPWWGYTNEIKSTGAFFGLKFTSGIDRSGYKVPIYSPVELQVIISNEKQLPRGVAIDPVNYVSYQDTNGDGMPDGNPLALYYDSARSPNPVVPLYIPTKGGAPQESDLYKDTGNNVPRAISASLYFTKEGTLRKSLSLHYYSRNPIAPRNKPYFITSIDSLENVHYGFVLYDKASPTTSRMMVEITGAGQIRVPYGIFPPEGKDWGENFDVRSQYGI